jgi:hypothetical protein
MIQEVGINVAVKQVVWVKARPDFDVLFQLLHNFQVDDRWRFWSICSVADEDICDIGDDLGQIALEVEILLPMLHNTDKCRGVDKMIEKRLKSEIAQQTLSDLGSLAP